MTVHPFIHWLENRIAQPLPGHDAQAKMISNLHRPKATEAPDNARNSSVLLLLTIQDNSPHITLILRTQDGGAHSGQIAFPGGKQEPTDSDATFTALREAQEEINLNPEDVQVLGTLTSMYIPVSNFIVNPIVAFAEDISYIDAAPHEVAQIYTISIVDLFDAKGDVEVIIHHPTKMKIQTKAYRLQAEILVWGATAMILSELEHLWDEYNSMHL